MSVKRIQIVKWSFPVFALVIGLLWYKRRRVDRADPGGNTNATCSRVDRCKNDTALSKPTSHLYDSGIQINESFSPNSSNQPTEEATRSPRKISESLDIPSRKLISQSISMHSITPSDDGEDWYNAESSSNKVDIQLGSNPKISNFDMVARSRSISCADNVVGEANGKVLKLFENVAEEEEQKLTGDNKALEVSEKAEPDSTNECGYIQIEGQTVSTPSSSSKTQIQVLSERDSANHSPVSGVLEGSVTDEAGSEGSTDSGKGGSIKGNAKDNTLPTLYEFSIPQHLVGRLIGRYGSFLQSVQLKAEVHIVVKRHPTFKNLKICAIDGPMDGINTALDMIRQKFPEKKFPQVTLEQIFPLKGPEELAYNPKLVQLSLIEGVNNDVVVCHIVKPNRFFVQLSTHPTYPALRILDESMTQSYNTTESPSAPDELIKGMILVAKWYNKWVRVKVEQPDPHGERHLVRLVDHGGYWYFSNAEMKKIRWDYVNLPFQAIEIFLANIQPKNGEWNQEACDVVAQMCYGTVGQAQIEGYIDTSTYVNLYLNIQNHGVISVADELVARGYAEPVPLESIVPEEGIAFS